MQRHSVVVGNVPSQPKNNAWKNSALNGAKSGKKGTGNRNEMDLRNLKVNNMEMDIYVCMGRVLVVCKWMVMMIFNNVDVMNVR